MLVIFLSMYTTITERTREIGILRSLGGSKAFIVGLIFQESAAICLVGVVVGIGGSFLIARAVQMAVSNSDRPDQRYWIQGCSFRDTERNNRVALSVVESG